MTDEQRVELERLAPLTTAEQRAALEALGGVLDKHSNQGEERWDWFTPDGWYDHGLILRRGREPAMCNVLPFGQAIQVAAILGITPPGYRLVPEEDCAEILEWCDWFERQGKQNHLLPSDVLSLAKRVCNLLACPAVLSPKEAEK